MTEAGTVWQVAHSTTWPMRPGKVSWRCAWWAPMALSFGSWLSALGGAPVASVPWQVLQAMLAAKSTWPLTWVSPGAGLAPGAGTAWQALQVFTTSAGEAVGGVATLAHAWCESGGALWQRLQAMVAGGACQVGVWLPWQ